MEKESLDKLHNTDTDTENVNKKQETRNKFLNKFLCKTSAHNSRRKQN